MIALVRDHFAHARRTAASSGRFQLLGAMVAALSVTATTAPVCKSTACSALSQVRAVFHLRDARDRDASESLFRGLLLKFLVDWGCASFRARRGLRKARSELLCRPPGSGVQHCGLADERLVRRRRGRVSGLAAQAAASSGGWGGEKGRETARNDRFRAAWIAANQESRRRSCGFGRVALRWAAAELGVRLALPRADATIGFTSSRPLSKRSDRVSTLVMPQRFQSVLLTRPALTGRSVPLGVQRALVRPLR